MKKPILFLLMIALTVSLYACRPRAEEDILISAPEKQTPTASTPPETEPKSETKQDTEQKSLDAEPDAKAEQTAVKDSEKPAETKQETVKYFVETKDGVEWKVPEEDPALRAEAEKLHKEKGEREYYLFCDKYDLKYYSSYTPEQTDLIPTLIHVYLKRDCSERGKALPPFEKYLGPVEIEDILAPTEHTPPQTEEQKAKFRNFYELTLPDDTTVAQVIEAVKKLEALPYVQRADLYSKNDVFYSD